MNTTPAQDIVKKVSEESGLIGKEVPNVIYHYTSIDALNGILFGKSDSHEMSFFFTHYQHLNDETEVLLGLSAISQIACKLMSEYHALYSSTEGAKFQEINAVDLLDKILNHLMVRFADEKDASDFLADYKVRNPSHTNGIRHLTEAFNEHRSSVFVGSFSSLGDSDRMFCDYAESGKGVCLKLDTKKILSIFPSTYLCQVNSMKYMEKPKVDATIEDFLRSIINSIALHKTSTGNLDALMQNSIEGDLFTLIVIRLIEFISNTKCPSWDHEEEIRIFHLHPTTKRAREIKYRVSKDGRLIPYVALSFPKEALLDIIPGRKCSEATKKAITLMKRTISG